MTKYERRVYLLMGFVATDLAMSLWDMWQMRKRRLTWDKAVADAKERAKDGNTQA